MSPGFEKLRSIQLPSEIWDVDFCATGACLASAHRVYRIDLTAGDARQVVYPRRVLALAACPTSDFCAVIDPAAGVVGMDTGGRVRWTVPVDPPLNLGNFADVAVSNDGRFVACSLGGNSIRVINAESGAVEYEHSEAGTPFFFDVAFSPDGKSLAVADMEDTLVIQWRVPTVDRIVLPKREEEFREIRHLAWSPNGRLLAIGEWFEVRVFDLVARAEIRPPEPLWVDCLICLRFSPSGRTLGACSETYKVLWLYNADDLSLDAYMGSGLSTLSSFAFSPDESVIAVSGFDGSLGIYGREAASPTPHPQA